MELTMDRRVFLRDSSLMAAALALLGRAEPVRAAEPMASIELGELEVSRFVLGSNPFFGWAHQPGDAGQQMIDWYTDERIMETMDVAAGLGVTTLATAPDARFVDLWRRYRERGGKLTVWLAQCHAQAEDIPAEIDRAVEAGAAACFIQGHRVEQQYEGGTFDTVREWIARIHDHGLPAGMAAHIPTIHPEAQEKEFGADFYFQCLYNCAHGDDFADADRDTALQTIAGLDRPVVAYKLLAAGRNEPQPAIEYALERLRPTDGICVGIYTRHRPNELQEDVAYFQAAAGAPTAQA